jgi:RNA polymerase subunit RPABC4/transcription elongation factor Spt4
MRKLAQEGEPCPRCGSELHAILCASCYGTGKSGSRACKACQGTGMTIGCPNFRSHRIWPWNGKIIPRLALK